MSEVIEKVWNVWSDHKPHDLREGRILLWKTSHRATGLNFIMHAPLRRMCNGWTDTYHILPPMTGWDGYKHLIPSGLEWSEELPDWLDLNPKDYSSIYHHRLFGLVSIEGLDLKACPFSGKSARWLSRGGFVGSMPHQDEAFAISGSLTTRYFCDPRKAAEFWNTRSEATA